MYTNVEPKNRIKMNNWLLSGALDDPHTHKMRYRWPIHEAIEIMQNDKDRNVYLIPAYNYNSSTQNEYMFVMQAIIIYIIDLVLEFMPMDTKQQDDLAHYLCKNLYSTYGYSWTATLNDYFENYDRQEEAKAVGINTIEAMYNSYGFVPNPQTCHEFHQPWLPILLNHQDDDRYFHDNFETPHLLGKARKKWTMHLLQKNGEALSYLELMPNFCFDLKSQGVNWRSGCLDAGRMYIEGFMHGIGKSSIQDAKLNKAIQHELDTDSLKPIEELLEELTVFYPRPH